MSGMSQFLDIDLDSDEDFEDSLQQGEFSKFSFEKALVLKICIFSFWYRKV